MDIDGKNFFDQPVNDLIKQYDEKLLSKIKQEQFDNNFKNV